MTIIIEKQVYKDADKLPKYIQEQAAQQIEMLKAATTLSNVLNIRPIEGTEKPFYRLKFGKYRFIIHYNHVSETIKVLSLTHRKDAYKKQNLPCK